MSLPPPPWRPDPSDGPRVLDCGCTWTTDEGTGLGTLVPCGELHRDVARRMRRPGARWVVGSVPR